MKKWFSKWFHRSQSGPSVVILRDSREPGDSRHLSASLDGDGSLTFEGLDYGDTVEKLLGFREYEWRWRLSPEDVAKLHQVLGADSDLLTSLKDRFSGDAAGDLTKFFDEHNIAYEFWCRNGD